MLLPFSSLDVSWSFFLYFSLFCSFLLLLFLLHSFSFFFSFLLFLVSFSSFSFLSFKQSVFIIFIPFTDSSQIYSFLPTQLCVFLEVFWTTLVGFLLLYTFGGRKLGVRWGAEELGVGEQGLLFGFYILNLSSLQDVKAGTQTGKKRGGRSLGRGHRGALLTGLLLVACSVFFLIAPRTMSPEVVLPTMGWDFH